MVYWEDLAYWTRCVHSGVNVSRQCICKEVSLFRTRLHFTCYIENKIYEKHDAVLKSNGQTVWFCVSCSVYCNLFTYICLLLPLNTYICTHWLVVTDDLCFTTDPLLLKGLSGILDLYWTCSTFKGSCSHREGYITVKWWKSKYARVEVVFAVGGFDRVFRDCIWTSFKTCKINWELLLTEKSISC